jgi:hypothetical protein
MREIRSDFQSNAAEPEKAESGISGQKNDRKVIGE